MDVRAGGDIWIPCEVHSGPFRNERRVYLKVGEAEWFGFVSENDIRDDDGKSFVRATILDVGPDGLVVQLRGQSMGSGAIEAPQKEFMAHGAFAA